MAFETRKQLCRVQSRMSEHIGSTSSRLLLVFGGLEKLAKAQALSPGLFNVPTVAPGPSDELATALVSSKAPLRVYLNEKVQDII